nr:AraC family transcriptional regulator [Pseudomaricurvus alkylphenolicus]
MRHLFESMDTGESESRYATFWRYAQKHVNVVRGGDNHLYQFKSRDVGHWAVNLVKGSGSIWIEFDEDLAAMMPDTVSLIYMMSGYVSIDTPTSTDIPRCNEIMLYRPHEGGRLHFSGDFSYCMLMIPKDELLDDEQYLERNIAVSAAQGLGAILASTLRAFVEETFRPGTQADIATALPSVRQLVSNCFQQHSIEALARQPPMDRNARIKYWLEQHAREPSASIERAATETGMSVRSLQRVLAEQQDSFKRAILRYRLDYAASRLSEPDGYERPLSEVSLECGFNSEAHFSRSFSKHFGITPGKFRKEHWSKRTQ